MEILPATSGATLVTDALGVITANIVPILAVLGFAWGVKYTRKFLGSATKGRV